MARKMTLSSTVRICCPMVIGLKEAAQTLDGKILGDSDLHVPLKRFDKTFRRIFELSGFDIDHSMFIFIND